MENDNLQIIKRLLELASNQMTYELYPKPCRDEYIFLANELNCALSVAKHDFDKHFHYCVGNYKQTLAQGKGYGWFHDPGKLVWLHMRVNQLRYAIYGERFVNEIKFNESLKKRAYKDLIEQIDRTVLMNKRQIAAHNREIDKVSKEVIARILAEDEAEAT